MGRLPLWLALAVVFRDLVILTGGVLYHYLIEDVQPAPMLISKLNTMVQILLVVAVIADAGPIAMPAPVIEVMIWVCLATTLASGLLYVLVWGNMARARGARR
jgi:cardiolipin synthase